MKSKYIKILISGLLITFIVSFLPSCGKSTGQTVNKDPSNTSENLIDLSSIGTSSDESQSYWNPSEHNIARGENGYYFLSDLGDYLMYFDEETHTSFPLCGKADCKHTDSTCNAFLGKHDHLMDTIYYYRNNVYLLALSNGNAILERVNADGSGRQEIGKVGESDGGSGSEKLVFSGDFVYVFYRGHENSNAENTEVVNKMSLDGKSEETIFEFTGTNARIYNGRSYGNKLLFLIETYKKDENKNYDLKGLGLYAYDYITGETSKVIDDNISDYSVDLQNNMIYYFVVGEGLYKMNISTKETKKIFEANEDCMYGELSYDGRYLYIDNEFWIGLQLGKIKIQEKCWVVDANGTIINTIPCDDFLEMYFGDEKFLFGFKINNTGGNSMVFIDKKNIENVKEWSRLGSPIK